MTSTGLVHTGLCLPNIHVWRGFGFGIFHINDTVDLFTGAQTGTKKKVPPEDVKVREANRAQVEMTQSVIYDGKKFTMTFRGTIVKAEPDPRQNSEKKKIVKIEWEIPTS